MLAVCVAATSAPSRLPVLYVFGQNPVDGDDVVARATAGLPDFASRTLVLLHDAAVRHAIPDIKARLEAAGAVVVCPVIPDEAFPPTAAGAGAAGAGAGAGAGADGSAGAGAGADAGADSKSSADPSAGAATGEAGGAGTDTTAQATHEVVRLLGAHEARSTLTLGGQTCPLPDGVTPPDCTILYIGEQGPRLTHIGMRYSSTPCWSYSPSTKVLRQETAEVNSELMKRYVACAPFLLLSRRLSCHAVAA